MGYQGRVSLRSESTHSGLVFRYAVAVVQSGPARVESFDTGGALTFTGATTPSEHTGAVFGPPLNYSREMSILEETVKVRMWWNDSRNISAKGNLLTANANPRACDTTYG